MGSCSYEVYRKTRFFASLDGLRGLSILGVIWHHTGVRLEGWPLTEGGHLGVDLFFAISGFLITTLLLREFEQFGRISLRAFYARRCLRIFPLYYSVTLLYVVTVSALDPGSAAGREFFQNLPYFLTYTSNWFVHLDGRVIFYFAWSLAAEEQFYLVWPAIEKAMRGWRPAAVIAGLLLARELVETAVAAGHLRGDRNWVVIVLSIQPAILAGVLVAHVLHDRRSFEWARQILGRPLAAPLFLVSLLASIQFELPLGIITVLMALLVGAVVINEGNGLAPLLTWRPVAHIGLVSYGVYLLHMLCYNAVKRVLEISGFVHPWLAFPATVLVATAAATLSYRYYESWFLRYKGRFARIKT